MIEDYIDPQGTHRWRGVAGNGRVVGECIEGFPDRQESDANKRRLLGMLVAWSVSKGQDPDLYEFALSTQFGDIEVSLRIPRRVRESWDDLNGRQLLAQIASQLVQFDPASPRWVHDDSTTHPLDLSRE